MPIFRLPEFIIGVGVYFLWFGRENQAAWLVTLLLTIATALWLSQVGGSLPLFMAHNWLVIPAVGAALVHFSSSSIGTSSRILGSGMLVWLGRFSYCFYSFQYHSLAITSKIDQIYAITSWQKFALSLTLLLLISVVGYHFIEVPARRWLLRCKSSPASAARQAQAA
jgi:peptidoglycan/LPS O-acetylase OafA/YrhL